MKVVRQASVLFGLLLYLPSVLAEWILKEEVQSLTPSRNTQANVEYSDRKKGTTELRTYYIRKNAMRMVEHNGDFLIIAKFGDKFSAYQFDVNKKKYQDASQTVPLMAQEAMYYIDCDSHSTCQPRADTVIQVENEKKKINGISVTKVTLLATQAMQMMGNEDIELWLSKDVKALRQAEYQRMAIYTQFLEQMGLITAGSSQIILNQFRAVLKKHGGKVAVRQRNTLKTNVFIKERPILDDQYEIPTGYTLSP